MPCEPRSTDAKRWSERQSMCRLGGTGHRKARARRLRGGSRIAKLLRCLPACRIVAITADGHAPLKARRLQANGFVRKPFRVDALLAAVRTVITDQSPLPAEPR